MPPLPMGEADEGTAGRWGRLDGADALKIEALPKEELTFHFENLRRGIPPIREPELIKP
jgi:hypothetical protein